MSYVFSSTRNLSPFEDEDEEDGFRLPDKSTLVVDDDSVEETSEANPKFSFRPSEIDPDSPEPPYTQASETSSSLHRYSFAERSRLTLDDGLLTAGSDAPTTSSARTELWAPAGKLGVAIDVVDGQPVVHRVKEDSPLDGFLLKGDKIVAIDETDTSRMSAADVTAVMVRRMTKRRKITYIRGSVTNY